MSDYIIRGMAADKQVRFFAANTKDLVEKARRIHNTSPIATAALGRLMTGTAMMGSMCKNDSDIVTVQIKGDGPMGGLVVTSDAKARVKGYVYNKDVMLPPNAQGKLDVGGAIGNGVLTVIKDLGLKEPYSGQTNLITGEIAEDLTYYFASSEQIPTSVDMMAELFEGMDMTIEDKIPTEFYCNCSKERVSRAVISVGKKELADMIEEGKPIEVNCHFCNSHYNFSVEELEEMLKAAR